MTNSSREPAAGLVARIRREYRRLYPAIPGEWFPVVNQNDLGSRIALGNGREFFVFAAHLEVKAVG